MVCAQSQNDTWKPSCVADAADTSSGDSTTPQEASHGVSEVLALLNAAIPPVRSGDLTSTAEPGPGVDEGPASAVDGVTACHAILPQPAPPERFPAGLEGTASILDGPPNPSGSHTAAEATAVVCQSAPSVGQDTAEAAADAAPQPAPSSDMKATAGQPAISFDEASGILFLLDTLSVDLAPQPAAQAVGVSALRSGSLIAMIVTGPWTMPWPGQGA